MNLRKYWYVAGMLFLVANTPSVCAQGPGEPNAGSRLEWDTVNEIYRLKWWGDTGHTYFIQQSENLTEWSYLLVVKAGENSILEQDVSLLGERNFLRLKSTDFPSPDPETADPDNDALGNLAELQLGLDPLNPDTDGNGIIDGFENPDGDQILHSEEVLLGTDPFTEDIPSGSAPVTVYTPLEIP